MPICRENPGFLPVIMKRIDSPCCRSVHFTAYYFTDCRGESQGNFHKNIKIPPNKFGNESTARVSKNLFFNFFHGNIAQKGRFTVKIRENENNLMILR